MSVLLPSIAALRQGITAAAEEHGRALGREVTDEQAVPSYLRGWWLSRRVFWGKLGPIVRAASPRPSHTMLDFGCGTGILLPTWVGHGARVWATDLHMEMAKSLARRFELRDVTFVDADSWASSIPDGSLDTIVAANVLEHVEDRPALYATFLRKLAPEGRLVVSGPTENALYRLGRRLIGFTGDYHVTTIADLFREIEAAGFAPEWRRRYPVPGPACLYRIARFHKVAPMSENGQTARSR